MIVRERLKIEGQEFCVLEKRVMVTKRQIRVEVEDSLGRFLRRF